MRRGGITVSTADWRGMRMVRHCGEHGRLEWNEESPALQSARPVGRECGGARLTVSTAGGSEVRRVRYSGQHDRLEWGEDDPS